jgi:hypothetical protein
MRPAASASEIQRQPEHHRLVLPDEPGEIRHVVCRAVVTGYQAGHCSHRAVSALFSYTTGMRREDAEPRAQRA